MALCSLLAFWTGGDPGQMDRLFRDSGLIREKWDEQHFADGSTYGEKTIERAIAGTEEFYDPASQSPATEAPTATPSVATESNTQRNEDRSERIEDLEAQLRSVIQENERLRDELETVRQERDDLRTALEDERDDGGWFKW